MAYERSTWRRAEIPGLNRLTACIFLFPKIHPLSEVAYSPLSPYSYSFFYFLFIAIFIFDCIYVGLLWRARKQRVVAADGA